MLVADKLTNWRKKRKEVSKINKLVILTKPTHNTTVTALAAKRDQVVQQHYAST